MALLTSAVLLTGLSRSPVHPDESQFIATSYYWEAYSTGNFASPVWAPDYWTQTQPPLTRYLIGLFRSLGGFTPAQLNQPWDFNLDAAGNAALGAVPSPQLRWWSRLPMALLSCLGFLILFRLASRALGLWVGALTLLLLLANPFVVTAVRNGMGEAPLLAFVLFAALAADEALRRWHAANARLTPAAPPVLMPTLAWFAGLGLASGLAGSGKLNGLTALALVPALWPRIWRLGRAASPRLRLRLALIAALIAGLTLSLVFVGLNPYLYPQPLGRTVLLLRQRAFEMHIQMAAFPEAVFGSPVERVLGVGHAVFQDFATLSFTGAWLLNLPLALAGLVLMLRAARHSRPPIPRTSTALTLILTAALTAGPSLLTPLRWDRYFLLPVIFTTLYLSLALVTVVRQLLRHLALFSTTTVTPPP